jgi:hypothetical protein
MKEKNPNNGINLTRNKLGGFLQRLLPAQVMQIVLSQ